MTRVKICGIRTLADAEHAVRAGADLIGLNLIPSSPRFLDCRFAAELVGELRSRLPLFGAEAASVEIVAVVANLSLDELHAVKRTTGVDCLQLHGDEPPELLAALGLLDYKAVRVASPEDVELARRYPGRRLLVDAKVPGQLGGTGQRFDWQLVRELTQERDLIVAGGLTPSNVTQAVHALHPWAVDVASGVERAPGVKDPELVEAFVKGARG